MTKETAIRKNLELLEEFMKYSLDHPEVLDNISKEAQLIILPENDPVLFQANQQIVDECKRANRKYVVFRMRMPDRSTPHLQEISR